MKKPYFQSNNSHQSNNSNNNSHTAYNNNNDGNRINEQISAREVRLIDSSGTNLGIVPLRVAMDKANQVGLDLVEISGGNNPPVCKILDYGKYKYAEAKKRNEAKKHQKIIEVKEIKLRPGIDKHDFEIKARAVKAFLEDGDKVKLTIRFRGREMAHAEFGLSLLEKLREDTKLIARVDQAPQLDGKQMMMILSPLSHQAETKPTKEAPAAKPAERAEPVAKPAFVAQPRPVVKSFLMTKK